MDLARILAPHVADDRHACPFCHRADAAAYRPPFLGLGHGRVVCAECGAAGPGVAPRAPAARQAAAAAWYAAAPRTVRDPDTGRFRRIAPAPDLVAAAREAARWAGFAERCAGETAGPMSGANVRPSPTHTPDANET